MAERLRVGLVGAGNIASVRHLPAMQDSAAIKVVGVYDVDRARAEQRAAQFDVERVYDSWPEMLADPQVQVVGVLLWPRLHGLYTIEALEAGKHVVCEKPLGVDLAECDAMLDAARRAGRRLFMVQNRLYHVAYERMGELVQQGAIGPIFLAQTNGFEGSSRSSRRSTTDARSDGVLLQQAVHPAYVLRWLLGDVERVSCLYARGKIVETAAEQTAIVTLSFASGVLAEMTATFDLGQGPSDHAIMLYGEGGAIELRFQQGDPSPQHSLRLLSTRLYGDKALHDVELPESSYSEVEFRRMWEDYAQAIQTGGPARISEVDGRKAVEVIVAARRSAELGRVVQLPL